MSRQHISRRRFLAATATTAAISIVPRHVLGGTRHTPPSEMLTAGLIGCGGQGGEDLNSYIKGSGGDYKLLAACDVDKVRLANARRKFGEHVELYTDWRRVIERKDIDVISIATPPHWHALMCIAAAQAGKDILCEKPMTRFIAEGRAVVTAVKRYARVFQIGTGRRFGAYESSRSRTIHNIMRSRLLKHCPAVYIDTGFRVKAYCGRVNLKPEPVPARLDWDMYCGPSPLRPYHPHRVGWSHRYYWDYEGGGLMDLGAHAMDGVQWIYAKDDTSPVEVEACAVPAHPKACGVWEWVELKYADGFTIVLDGGREWGKPYDRKEPRHVELSDLDEESRRKVEAMPEPEPLLSFVEAVKTRKEAGGHAEASHRVSTILHLANIAIRLGRKIKYDPVKEEIIGDEVANRYVYQPMRAPWHL